ncbi:uncharacterized protein I206_105074 [Kwoniella pini CBS 10737]|uniref:Uncharacterized protein n=1 Tax=Kwoniella pini CBS 10737 TaxID=1296096 RepID=A0A1B9I8J2_9TREE|nr:uncharacterized protein I206_02614 [Kwoniella pini CBS 10737]OCF51898.1 hypothetical protein I206_02614 [Kwoniella pini CBS 10737]
MPVPGIIPSSFLPPLPRNQYTLSPLLPPDILARISILKELYLPPIHGGFTSADVFDNDEDFTSEKKVVRTKKRERRFSAGLVETMDNIGLGLDVSLDQANGLEVLDEEESSEISDEGEGTDSDEEEEEDSQEHLDPFEREWSEKWLGGIIRRSQNWLEENETPLDDVKDVEIILRDATAVLAMMAGTSAAGSLTRHLVFPLLPSLAPALSKQSRAIPNPALSPETNTFLASLSTSPTSPKDNFHSHFRRSSNTTISSSPTNTTKTNQKIKKRKEKKAILPILLHDAPMGDHLSVGVQTWGSAILLGRKLALNPEEFGLFPLNNNNKNMRILELGAGTGLLSILCKKLLDLKSINEEKEKTSKHLIIATDFLKSVLDNLKICIDLNFPNNPLILENENENEIENKEKNIKEGIHICKLDWTTFPNFMESNEINEMNETNSEEEEEELKPFLNNNEGFDLILASDCVYDETHAKLLRKVVSWTLKLPDKNGNNGGTFHILSPLRPTFAPELESIDKNFPNLSTYLPLKQRQDNLNNNLSKLPESEKEEKDEELKGEGLGLNKGFKIGVKGNGKKSVKGRKGEGRVDEVGGYWWWEVGWG